MKTEFTEKQKFTQWWLWLILAGIGFLPIYGIYKQLILGEAFGNKPMSDVGLIVFSIFVFGLITLFGLLNLKTEIDQHEVRMHFFPFAKKKISWNDIKHAQVVDYGFVGGWGIRIGSKYGTIYNVSGSKGLAIELKDGKKFVIGTQREIELEKVINNIQSKR